MKKIKTFLLLLLIVFSIQKLKAQVYRFEATGFSVLEKTPKGTWGQWSELEPLNIMITLDTDKNRIVVYSKEVQLYQIQNYEKKQESNKRWDFDEILSNPLSVKNNASLLNCPPIYKPFKYPWAFDAWKIQQQIHWLPDEVPMADDIKDWKYNLTESEKNLCTQLFRFFTQADIEVNDCYMTKYSNIFKPIEVKMMLAAFSNMETIHIVAYSHLIETLGMPESLYVEFVKYKEMRDKYDYMQKFGTETKEGVAKTMAVFGAFTEGVQLFSTFAMFLLQRDKNRH